MKNLLTKMRDAEDGATAIEYALFGALIAVLIGVSVGIVGEEIVRLYTDIKDKIVLANK